MSNTFRLYVFTVHLGEDPETVRQFPASNGTGNMVKPGAKSQKCITH